jgi:hypothetical protein
MRCFFGGGTLRRERGEERVFKIVPKIDRATSEWPASN